MSLPITTHPSPGMHLSLPVASSHEREPSVTPLLDALPLPLTTHATLTPRVIRVNPAPLDEPPLPTPLGAVNTSSIQLSLSSGSGGSAGAASIAATSGVSSGPAPMPSSGASALSTAVAHPSETSLPPPPLFTSSLSLTSTRDGIPSSVPPRPDAPIGTTASVSSGSSVPPPTADTPEPTTKVDFSTCKVKVYSSDTRSDLVLIKHQEICKELLWLARVSNRKVFSEDFIKSHTDLGKASARAQGGTCCLNTVGALCAVGGVALTAISPSQQTVSINTELGTGSISSSPQQIILIAVGCILALGGILIGWRTSVSGAKRAKKLDKKQDVMLSLAEKEFKGECDKIVDHFISLLVLEAFSHPQSSISLEDLNHVKGLLYEAKLFETGEDHWSSKLGDFRRSSYDLLHHSLYADVGRILTDSDISEDIQKSILNSIFEMGIILGSTIEIDASVQIIIPRKGDITLDYLKKVRDKFQAKLRETATLIESIKTSKALAASSPRFPIIHPTPDTRVHRPGTGTPSDPAPGAVRSGSSASSSSSSRIARPPSHHSIVVAPPAPTATEEGFAKAIASDDRKRT